LFKDPLLNVSDRRHLGGAAHENPGHAATFLNQKLDAVIGSQPYCLCWKMSFYSYEHPLYIEFQLITDTGQKVFSNGVDVERSASIDVQDQSGAEWGEKYLILKQKIQYEGRTYEAFSGFAAERLLEIIALNSCTVRSQISGRDPEKFEVVELAKFGSGTDSRSGYYAHVITKVPTEDNQFEEGFYSIRTKYCLHEFRIVGLRLRDTGEIIYVEGRLGSDPFRPLAGASQIEGDVYFRIPFRFLFFTNTIGERDRNESGDLPTFTQIVGPGPEDVKTFHHTWWRDFITTTPIVWNTKAEQVVDDQSPTHRGVNA